ncbi:hypothetical protein ACQY0O_006692 [Thecaphora frezii]
MPKHTFIDTILKRPSQSYAESAMDTSAPGGSARPTWHAPSDLPNTPGRPQSILAGSIFKSGGKGSLGRAAGESASNAPSVAGTSPGRFSRFRKKDHRPSISNGSVFEDGATSIVPYAESNTTYSSKKGRWWETGSLKLGKSSSRAPSVAGSIFSEPEATPAVASLSGLGSLGSPARGTRSDYGGAPSRQRLQSAPPMPTLVSRPSIGTMRASSGVAPLGQQAPSLVRQTSLSSTSRSAKHSSQAPRPISPASSVGRSHRARSTHGSQDWKSFVDSMAGTEVAKTWESIPALAPSSPARQPQNRLEKRKSVVARVRKELEQDAQFEQLQRDSGVLAHAATQVIGGQPPLPLSRALNLQPGALVSSASVTQPALTTTGRIAGGCVSPPRSPIAHLANQPWVSVHDRSSPIPLAVPAVRAVPAPIENYVEASSVQASPMVSTAAAETDESESEAETEENSSASSSEDEILPNQTLDVVAEEEEESSSNGHERHHEMKNIPTVRGKSTSRRYSEYDAVLRHHQSGSNVIQETEVSLTDVAPRIAISKAKPSSPAQSDSVASESPAESPLFKQPGSDAELTLSSLPPAVAAADKQVKPIPNAEPGLKGMEVASAIPTRATSIPTLSAPGSQAVSDEGSSSESEAEAEFPSTAAPRPPLVARQSSASNYRSAKGGRSTPTSKGVTFHGNNSGAPAPTQSGALASAVIGPDAEHAEGASDGQATERDDENSEGSDSAKTTTSGTRSLSSRRAVSIRSSRSSRPGTLPRRISDISLGTSFALSGILGGHGRSSSRRVRLNDDDSDSPVDVSDDDADLRERAMAEQDRLRKMNVGDDFFGPSLTGLLDRFDRMSWSDTSVDRLGMDGRSGSIRRADSASIGSKAAAQQAQDTINEVRQRRAEKGQDEDGKTRASSSGGLAPSFAALWLLSEAQEGRSEAEGNASALKDDSAPSSAWITPSALQNAFAATSQSPASKYASFFTHSTLSKQETSVLNRPRFKPARPDEMGGLKISLGKLSPEHPVAPPEDMRSTLPMSLSSSSSIYSSSKEPETKAASRPAIIGVASKDKPAPKKSAMKNLRHSKSLADTLFSIPVPSPEAKAEKADRKREKVKGKSRRSSDGNDRSSGGGKSKSKQDSKDKAQKSKDPLPISAMVSELSQETLAAHRPASSSADSSLDLASSMTTMVPIRTSSLETQPVAISEKVAGKRPQRDAEEADRGDGTDRELAVRGADTVDGSIPVSEPEVQMTESVAHFETPDQSLASISHEAPLDSVGISPPQKFHTAKDLATLAGPDSPAAATLTRSSAQKSLLTHFEAAEEFAPFSLAGFSVQPDEFKKDPKVVAAAETGGDILAQPELGSEEGTAAATAPQNEVAKPLEVEEQPPEDPEPVHQLYEGERDGSVASGFHEDGVPADSEISAVSTTQTTPLSSDAPAKAELLQQADAEGYAAAVDKHLPMPPRPEPAEVVLLSHDDKTPIGNPPRVGINVIPPTPPANDARLSYVGAQTPTTPTIQEGDPFDVQPQRPPLLSRSSSQKAISRLSGINGKTGPGGAESLVRSKSVSTKKKQVWQEYHGKGLSLPPGLIATKVASSVDHKNAQPLDAARAATTASTSTRDDLMKKPSKKRAPALQTMPAASATRDVLPAIPEPEMETAAPLSLVKPRSPLKKHQRTSSATDSISPSSSMAKIMADAPPVPRIPEAYHSPSPFGSSASRFDLGSEAMSRGASSSGSSVADSCSPAPSNVPSQSGRSNVSWVSSSVHSASVRSSPRPEYSYTNHELSPYARKMRALSSGPAPGASPVPETRRNSLMSAINDWENQMPSDGEARPASPNPSVANSTRYPPLPASTISRPSSVLSAASSPAVVRSAPLGDLHPPVPRSRISPEERAAVVSQEGHMATPFHGINASVTSFTSTPSATQSVASLPSTMQTVPTSYRPNKDPGKFSGNAEELLHTRTTMQTIAVSSGAFASRSKSMVRRKSAHEVGGEKRSSLEVPDHLQDELNLTTLSLTAHTPPPRKVSSSQVLVQVIAVAIDEMDRLLLRERARTDNAFGFVPGRSFCGRIVECGYEVKKMRKGDVVFGLQDSRKCGALAEFMTIDSSLVCHAPKDCLTTEQIAALPSAGVTAFQILHKHCAQLPRGARVLILNAHDAIGLLTMQEAVGLGLIIVAQCPPSVSDGVAVCQANGAHEVVIGEPLWAINSLHESSFDLVVDTVGGRKIYDASRRILAFEGQFTTCFGDEHSTANPNLKSHLRSLRRAFFKKDKKNLGYEWVGADTGEDCREALEAVKKAAEKGEICPRLRSVLPFADAPRAFDPARNHEDEPGAIVVRVS